MTLAEPRQTASCGVGFQAPGRKRASVDNWHRPAEPVSSQHFRRPVDQHKHRVAVAPAHRQVVVVGVDLKVVSQEVGEGSETVDGDYTGEDLTIAFNPSYLIEGIEAVAGDEVIIETSDATRPATVRSGEQDSYRYLLMPVRVS